MKWMTRSYKDGRINEAMMTASKMTIATYNKTSKVIYQQIMSKSPITSYRYVRHSPGRMGEFPL
jgi:hypothetical protein